MDLSTIEGATATVEEVERLRRQWIRDPSQPFRILLPNQAQGIVFWAGLCRDIQPYDRTEGDNDPIVVFSQFYIDSDDARAEEIKRSLVLVANNKSISRVYLINERIYTAEEMGFDTLEDSLIFDEKIVQVDHGSRMTYKAVFDYVDTNKIEGHIVICNSDIFFDQTVDNVRRLGMKEDARALCLLRYEYDGEDKLKNCELFGPRADSQDTWVIHSSHIPKDSLRKPFDMALGIPGCDNKMTYLLQISGIECFNIPEHVRTYHYHRSEKRNYDSTTKRVAMPWVSLVPNVPGENNECVAHSYNLQYENDRLHDYVSQKLMENKPFIIPRIAGVENNVALSSVIIGQGGMCEEDFWRDSAPRLRKIMKNNAGIRLDTMSDIHAYANLYLQAFHRCEMYFDWEPWGNVYPGIRDSHEFITNNFTQERVWSLALDVFHNVNRRPWTLSLRGKRLLIISTFADSIKEKIDILPKLYGVDLFPECTFTFLKPPQTQGDNDSKPFKEELGLFGSKIADIKNTFDVALVACGGYGNPLLGMLHNMEVSAIYIGGVLQMYFGVYGTRWLRERPDIMRLYLNKHWSRPKSDEKPKGHEKVESSCYW